MSIGGVLTAYKELEAAFDHAAAEVKATLWQVAEPDLDDLIARHQALSAKVAALGLGLVREFQARGMHTAVQQTAPAFLATKLTMSHGLAAEQVRLADALAERCPETGIALAQGQVSYEQVKAIVDVLAGLPDKATTEDHQRAEGVLLGAAAGCNATDIRKLAKRIDQLIDPDGIEPREETAKKKRGASIRNHGDGTQSIVWRDTDENIAMVKAALDPLAAPVPAANGERDPRTPAVRRADALLDLTRSALRFGDLPASRGERPHLHVTFTEQTLRNEPGHPFGRTATGEDLSAEAIRRLACDADLRGVLLNGDGVPLKLGRRYRSVTPAQWAALVARDRGCVFPSCTRPAAWSQAHHIRHWADGGPTDLENLALLCDAHHDSVHHAGWDIEMGPDGRPHLRPPPWVDPAREPVINLHWRIDQQLVQEGFGAARRDRAGPAPPG